MWFWVTCDLSPCSAAGACMTHALEKVRGAEGPSEAPRGGWCGLGDTGPRPDCDITPAADALRAHSPLFLEGSSRDSPPLPDAPSSSPQGLRAQRPERRTSQDSSHSESSASSDSLAPVGASHGE